jgi:ribosomal protein S27AE
MMSYLDKCENCGNVHIAASFGPYGFRVVCERCGSVQELNDLFEPVTPSTPVPRVIAVAG